ncbi:hypothetical protein [Paenibacillus sp. IHBB 10380]|uniref:hypothetical protein n=1 Tax=Paenibacillus sp. IHBB 10380 TaxID=1566358 RepID=UPI0005CFDD7E|nr:hypothetical protein [Paenibacillus sp. IHBB 10380]AJS59325.1 hypothetical protein UB51_13560 [Paenibacillus sp. IHBB 10380]
MIYVALVVGIILLVAAGMLARKNSQIIAEKRGLISTETSSSIQYTVHLTDQWTDREQSQLLPLFHVSYRDGEEELHAYLCRVTGTRGELKLQEAKNVMIHKIRHAVQKNLLSSSASKHESAINDDEKNMITELEQELAQR